MSNISDILQWTSLFLIVAASVSKTYESGRYWLQFAIYAILLSIRLAL